jgi:hypothetical protein
MRFNTWRNDMGELLCEVEANLVKKRCSKIVRFTERGFDIYQMPASSRNRGISEWIPCIEPIKANETGRYPAGRAFSH